MRRKIHLHGRLSALHDGPIEVVASTIAEAIKLVTLQLPGFKPNAVEGYKRIQIVGCNSVDDLIAESNMEDIHVFPQFNGGKRGGFVQVLVGAALVAASFINPVAGTAMAGFLFSLGASVVLGGVLQMFAAPKRDTPLMSSASSAPSADQIRNHYLGAPRNTVAIGTRIPILYGRRKVGGHFLSVNVNAV